MLYIEQPVGTGYSQGTPNIKNEDDLAAQFVGFLQQFLEVFPELKGKTTYLTGESVSSGLSFIGSWVLNSVRVLLSTPGCMFHVGRGSVCVRNCADLSQTLPIIFTKRRLLLIYRFKEFGSPTVGGLFTCIPPEILPSFPLAVLGWWVAQNQIPAFDFVRKYEHVFAFKYAAIHPQDPIFLSHSPIAKRS